MKTITFLVVFVVLAIFFVGGYSLQDVKNYTGLTSVDLVALLVITAVIGGLGIWLLSSMLGSMKKPPPSVKPKTYKKSLAWTGLVIFLLVATCFLIMFTMSNLGMAGLIVVAELALFAVFLVIVAPIIAWKTGYLDKLFTTVETGSIKFIDAGESHHRTYINIPGKVLKNGEIVDGNSEGDKTFLQREYGFYWVGFPFLGRKVHTFPISRDKEKESLTPNMDPGTWIQRSPEKKDVSELRFNFPRPVLVPDVKFNDGVEANILVLCRFEVRTPITPVYELKAGFFEALVSFVRTGVLNYCGSISSTDFKTADRLDGGTMSTNIISAVGKQILEKIGIEITGLSVAVYNLSSDPEEKAAKAKALAQQEGEALVATAEAQKKVTLIGAKAQAKAAKKIGETAMIDLTNAVKKLTELGVDPNQAAVVVGGVSEATRLSGPQSKITVVSRGATPLPLAIPIEPKK